MKKMKMLVIAIGLLLAYVAPAAALNCVVVVYYDPEGDPEIDTDLLVHTVSWNNLEGLRNEHDVLTIFINADNPLGNEASTVVTGHEEYALQHIPSSELDAREAIVFSVYDLSPEIGKKSTFRESLSVEQSVESTRFTAPNGLDRSVLAGMDVGFVALDFNDPAFDDAQLRSLNVEHACPVEE